jgi:hypothetical protein
VRKFFLCSGCVYVLGIVVLFVANHAYASERTVEFVGAGPAVFSGGTATATVHNFTDREVSVALSLTWSKLRDPAGRPVSPADAFTITPRLSIPAGSEKTAHVVRVETQLLAVGEYVGTLSFSSPSGFQDRIAISLVVEATEEVVPLKSPVTTWEVISQRPFPGKNYTDHNANVPLQQGPVATTTPTYETTLLGSNGGSLIALGQVTTNESYPYLKLTFVPGSDGAPPGAYTGTLDLAPDDTASGDITLTVQRRDEWYLPAMILGAALLLAWLGQRWWASGRRLSQLEGEAKDAKKTLGNGTPPAIGGLQLTGVSDLFDKAGGRRSELARRWAPVGSEDAGMIQAEADVKMLKDAAALWTDGTLQSSITALETALQTIKKKHPIKPPGALFEEPALVLASRLLLSGSVSVENLTTRQTQIDEATSLASEWPELLSSAEQLGTTLSDLARQANAMSIDERRSLNRARGVLSGVLWDLWHADTASDLLDRHTASELERVDEAVGQLSHWLGRPPPPVATSSLSRGLEVPSVSYMGLSGIWRVIASLFSPVSDEGSSKGDRALIRTLDASLVFVAFAVSIWGALVLLYFDKPFGTWRDYLGLIAWALGTTAALDIINGAVGKLAPPITAGESSQEVTGAV